MIKYVPGFEKAWVNDTSNEVGSRGYFQIYIHNPNGAEGYRQDGQGGHWIDLKDTYDIPLRCLVPANIDGIVLSGRCISGTSQAHGSYRTQGGIMGIGQASGVVEGLCAIKGVQPREIDVKAVQEQLLAFGASLWRDKEKTAREQAHTTECVKAYIKGRDKFITRDDVLKKFQD
ncbi:FAD-dependent oxidoreductase [Sodalis glossinidius]|uniref:FAD-dependent oxidoreductase n=1 Tax=Sodalis glossinidius TaxID=63612 RepID=UPI0002D9ACA6|nr:FAD-dependent oxidoreductase [Sodalis glossinidius]